MKDENIRYDTQLFYGGEWITIWSDISLSLSKELKVRKEKLNPENKYRIIKVTTIKEVIE